MASFPGSKPRKASNVGKKRGTQIGFGRDLARKGEKPWGAEPMPTKQQSRRFKHELTPAKQTKCGQRLANDVGKCDRIKGHAGRHSSAWQRKYEKAHGPI
jgi:hypothetical protein